MAGKVKYSNNGISRLTAPVVIGDTKISVVTTSVFPLLGPGDYMFLSLEIEVFKVIEVQGNDFILDPKDSLQGNYPQNTIVELRMTKELLDAAGDMGEY